MTSTFSEPVVEDAVVGWLKVLGVAVPHGPAIAAGEPTLTTTARELASAVRKNITIDWTVRENVRAQQRVILKRILRDYFLNGPISGRLSSTRIQGMKAPNRRNRRREFPQTLDRLFGLLRKVAPAGIRPNL